MSEKTTQQETKKKKPGVSIMKILKKLFLRKSVIIVVLILIIALPLSFGLGKKSMSDSKTVKLGFEDIGELSTQAAYCSNVNVTDKSRTLFGITIPFTQSKYVYSYDVTIKAGINFSDIKWYISKSKKIHVKLPNVKILSNEINLDSFKVYHEEESIFTPISLNEQNASLSKLKAVAEKTAKDNGLIEQAEENAKTMVKSFIGNAFDLNEYDVVFEED